MTGNQAIRCELEPTARRERRGTPTTGVGRCASVCWMPGSLFRTRRRSPAMECGQAGAILGLRRLEVL